MIKEFPLSVPPKICDYIINNFGKNMDKGTVINGELSKDEHHDINVLDSSRECESIFICNSIHPFDIIRKGISKVTKLPINHQECFTLVKYNKGGKYDLHDDAFDPDDSNSRSIFNDNNRLFSAMIYLNDDFEGGTTSFPNLNKVIQPQKGKTIIWSNINQYNKLDRNKTHSGDPITKGTKWVLVTWIREKPF